MKPKKKMKPKIPTAMPNMPMGDGMTNVGVYMVPARKKKPKK